MIGAYLHVRRITLKAALGLEASLKTVWGANIDLSVEYVATSFYTDLT